MNIQLGNSLVSRAVAVAAVMVLVVSASSFAGDIQIFCEAGLRVYLDGKFVGNSSEREDGLFLIDVPKGTHAVWIEKDGHVSQRFEIEVLNAPTEITVTEFVPLPAAVEEPPQEDEPAPDSEPVQQLIGSLTVTSAPQNCLVQIDGRTQEKTTPELVIGGLSAGDHVITFSKPGYEPIRGTVTVRSGADVTVRGNLVEGRVETQLEGKGSLRVISKPLRCDVKILDKQRAKTQRHLNLSYLPAGEHRLTVAIPGQTMSTKVMILNRTRTVVEVSFIAGDEPFVIRHVPFKD